METEGTYPFHLVRDCPDSNAELMIQNCFDFAKGNIGHISAPGGKNIVYEIRMSGIIMMQIKHPEIPSDVTVMCRLNNRFVEFYIEYKDKTSKFITCARKNKHPQESTQSRTCLTIYDKIISIADIMEWINK